MAEHWHCRTCGPHVAADEDGCCSACGRDLECATCPCETRCLGEWRQRFPTLDELEAHHKRNATTGGWSDWLIEDETHNEKPFHWVWHWSPGSLLLSESEGRRTRPLDPEGVVCEWHIAARVVSHDVVVSPCAHHRHVTLPLEDAYSRGQADVRKHVARELSRLIDSGTISLARGAEILGVGLEEWRKILRSIATAPTAAGEVRHG